VLVAVLLLLAVGPVTALYAFRFFATTEQPPGPYLLGLPAALLLAAALAIVLHPPRSETDRESMPERDRQEPHLLRSARADRPPPGSHFAGNAFPAAGHRRVIGVLDPPPQSTLRRGYRG